MGDPATERDWRRAFTSLARRVGDDVDANDDAGAGADGDREGRDAGDPGSSSGPEPPDDRRLPYDTVFDLLRNERRRFMLRFLRENGPSARGELAEALAAEENDVPREAVSARERKRVDVSLYQCHLPRLEEAGAVSSDRGLHLALGPTADQLFEHLDATPRRLRYHPVYPLATAVGAAGIAVWSVADWTWTGHLLVVLAIVAVLVTACVEAAGDV